MIGGSSRIPTVRQSIKDFFKNAQFDDKVHVDEAVAISAGMFMNDPDLIQIPVMSRATGIKKLDGTKSEMIPKKTSLPTSMTK